jgi:hypothetical protein
MGLNMSDVTATAKLRTMRSSAELVEVWWGALRQTSTREQSQRCRAACLEGTARARGSFAGAK